MECDTLLRKLGDSEADLAALKTAVDEPELAQCEAEAEKLEGERAPYEAIGGATGEARQGACMCIDRPEAIRGCCWW